MLGDARRSIRLRRSGVSVRATESPDAVAMRFHASKIASPAPAREEGRMTCSNLFRVAPTRPFPAFGATGRPRLPVAPARPFTMSERVAPLSDPFSPFKVSPMERHFPRSEVSLCVRPFPRRSGNSSGKDPRPCGAARP